MGTLKKSLLTVLMLLTVFNTVIAQSETDTSNKDTEVAVDSTVTDNYFSDAENAESSNTFKSTSSTWVYVKMIFFLALIIAAIYGVMWFFKKKANPQNPDENFMRRAATLPLSAGKTVEIVTLIDHAYILGVTDNNINLIGEIEDKELIEALNLNFDKNKNVKKPMNFADILDIFMPNGPREKNIFADVEKKAKNLSKNKE